MKEFNVTGSCNPRLHYMVDTSKRFEVVERYIESGKYFTINRARQYGKTTILNQVFQRLSDRFLIIPISFEGADDDCFSDKGRFTKMVSEMILSRLRHFKADPVLIKIWEESSQDSLDTLSATIKAFTQASSSPVVLTIDEVDKHSDNQMFLSFLGMLRNKYLDAANGLDSTFHSVILAGVYDIKNLKLKLRPDADKKYNSPWNIATDFTVDMTFHPGEIAKMLEDYEADNHTGMPVEAISEEIYRYTGGYPVLVSYICKLIDERLDRSWTSDGVKEAVKIILIGDNTLIDDLSKNLENYPELREFLYNISVNGADYTFNLVDPMVKFASMFSYIRNQGNKVRIHNAIFEESLYYYFTIAYQRKNSAKLSPFQMNYVIAGRLNMEYALSRFSTMMHEEYRVEDGEFLEKQGRLVFLSFIKPIINGTGFYYVEPQTRDNKRMDLVINYGSDEFIVELKLWRGEKYERSGLDQLAEYLDIRGKDEGYLVTFDFTKNKVFREPSWVEHNGKRIFEVII